jgi:glyoxylase-like metal-dependent hydrolase (beta-lactamase superfamily II)
MLSMPIRIELPFEPENSAVNVYLFPSPEPVLIDAGFNSPSSWAALETALKRYDVQIAQIRRVIITHPHIDHYGLAARIAKRSQAEIWIATLGAHFFYDFPEYWQRRIDYYRQEFLPGAGLPAEMIQATLTWMRLSATIWEAIPLERVVTFSPTATLDLGGRSWQVVHTPGHDSRLTCFYQPQIRHLLSSDMLMVPIATPVVEAPPPGQARRPALPAFVQSMERLAAFDIETVHPGHGAPFGNHRKIIHNQLQRIHERKEDCWRFLAAGASSVAEVFTRLYVERARQVGMAGVWMTLGYLDLLEAEGRLHRETRQGVWRYAT